MYRANAESAKSEIDDAISAKHDNETYEAPENGTLAFLTLPFVPRLPDEFKYAPEKYDKRARDKQ